MAFFSWEDDEDFAGGTRVLEEPDIAENPDLQDNDDNELYSHWVDAKKADAARITGKPVIALCGKVWHPTKDPDNYPICPKCKEIYERIIS